MLEIDSTHISTEEQQWKTISDARSGLFGIYGLLRAALAENNGYWIYGDVRSGDFVPYSRPDLKAVSDNKLTAAFPVLQALSDWRRFYAVINAASLFIERAPGILGQDPRYSETNLNYDLAQARALRAFTYFMIARTWGDAPLITASYDNGTFPERPKNSYREILNFAEQELLAVVNVLPYRYGVSPQTYYGANEGTWNGVLFNKLSAYAILSHISAWGGNYVNTEIYTNFVMEHYNEVNILGTTYTSVDNLTAADGFFSKRSPAQLVAFGFMDANGEATQEGHIETLTLAQPLIMRATPDIYVPRDTIFKAFPDLTDLRFGIDTATNRHRTNYFTNFNGPVPIFSKIKVIKDGNASGNYAVFGSVILFTRMEEILLLRTEALTQLNRKEDAVVLLNTLRENRGLPAYVLDDSKDVLKDVFAERRRELMGEGWQWYDLVRYNRIRKEDSRISALINSGGIYWPLSDEVLRNNSQLNQNASWN